MSQYRDCPVLISPRVPRFDVSSTQNASGPRGTGSRTLSGILYESSEPNGPLARNGGNRRPSDRLCYRMPTYIEDVFRRSVSLATLL